MLPLGILAYCFGLLGFPGSAYSGVPQIGDPVGGCPCNKNPTVWGLCEGPWFFGKLRQWLPRDDTGTPLRPMYILCRYMDPLGNGYEPW